MKLGSKDLLISVVVPVYNAEKFISRSIESVLSQSYDCLELLLVNDGSTDSSKKICEGYALSDKRVKVISQENKGPSAARNAGINRSSGEFIFFLDADDFISGNTLELLVNEYNECHADLVMANFQKLSIKGDVLKQSVSFHPNNELFEGVVETLSNENIVYYVRNFLKHPSNHLISYCWARLYKSSIIKENGILANENMRLFEDYVFNLEYLRYTKEIVFVNENLYTYSMHENHVSASMAILNAESLLHDMNVFRNKTRIFLRDAKLRNVNAEKEIGHTLIHYVIIFLVRSCRQITESNKKNISDEISQIVDAPIIRDSLKYYSPGKGNSRVLPFLMKCKLIDLIMRVCRFKAHKRYGKLNG